MFAPMSTNSAPSPSARQMIANGDRRISIGNGRRSQCQIDGGPRLREPGHHARHQRGGRIDVAQRRQLLDRLLDGLAAARALQRPAHGRCLMLDAVNPWLSMISRSIARARTTRIFSVVIGSCRMPRISS